MEFDRDLQSIQQARDFMKKAKQAQKQFQNYTQEQIDHIVYSVAEACEANAERLASMRVMRRDLEIGRIR